VNEPETTPPLDSNHFRDGTELGFLPRTFLARTSHGSAFYWDRELGLLARDERTGHWRGLGPDELRRGYPEAWWVWTHFAALLPGRAPGGLSRSGGDHAS